MKNLMIMAAIFFGIAIILPATTIAQCCNHKEKSGCNKSGQTSTQTTTVSGVAKDSLKVSGLCGMCKTRIEKAAKSVKGVTDAQWNDSTSMLIYSFDGTVKKEDVSNAITEVGHDTELGKAPDKVYNKLPGCCKYR